MRTQKEFHESGIAKLVKSHFGLAIGRLSNRIAIANSAQSTIRNYCRSVKQLYLFHGISPESLVLLIPISLQHFRNSFSFLLRC